MYYFLVAFRKKTIIFSQRVNWIVCARPTEHACRSLDSLLTVPVPSASFPFSFPHNTTKSHTGRNIYGLHKSVNILNPHIHTHWKHTVKYPSHLEAAYYIWLCGINTWNRQEIGKMAAATCNGCFGDSLLPTELMWCAAESSDGWGV